MEQWPPALPENDRYVRAFGAVVKVAKTSLLTWKLDPQERRIVGAMNRINTTIALQTQDPETGRGPLAVVLETMAELRLRSFRALRPVETTDLELPTSVTHAAVNSLGPKRAAVLADTLVNDFAEWCEAQTEAMQASGASDRVVKQFSLEHFNARLRKLYEQIRSRTLPTD